MLKVAVGSKNPVKIKAVEVAFRKVFNLELNVVGISVPSDVSDMPINLEEMFRGARNRANKARIETGADFGVGLEDGFEDKTMGTFLSNFTAIVDRRDVWGYARGGGLLVPKKIVKRVREQKKELGKVMDEIRGIKNTKQREGFNGFMTNNLISRQKALEGSIIYALSRFTNGQLF